MVKRILATWIIFFVTTAGLLLLFSKIGWIDSISLQEGILNSTLVTCFYLILLRIYTKRHAFTIGNIFAVLIGTIIVFGFLQKNEIIRIEQVKPQLEFAIYGIMIIIEGIVAKIEGDMYDEEKFIESMKEEDM